MATCTVYVGNTNLIELRGLKSAVKDAFIDDATRALTNWIAMPLADQRQFRAKFVAVRQKVLRRIAAGSPAQRVANAGLRTRYVAVVVP